MGRVRTFKELQAEVVPLAVKLLKTLTPTQRVEVLSEFCYACGADDPCCPCDNDE